MTVNLFDDQFRDRLLPLAYTRPIADLRIGIMTIAQKWAHDLAVETGFLTVDYLQEKFTALPAATLLINGRVLPTASLVSSVLGLKSLQGLKSDQGDIIAYQGIGESSVTNWVEVEANFIRYPEDIFAMNGSEIELDFARLTSGRKSQPLSKTNQVVGEGDIFLEPGSRVEGCIIDPDGGYIYIGKEAEIMPGSLIHGSLAVCDNATIKMGAKIYGPTTIGPHSKAGGEINNSVFIGYSNKGHDGFLGNSVIGEWCNLGADTNNSNLKNNYANVKIWDYTTERFRDTGMQFCGLIMGDHSKCGINTMFNTGTVVGVSANIFGSGFPRNLIPSFAWGGSSGFTTYQLKKVYETAEKVFERRSLQFDRTEKTILSHIFEMTSSSRFWEDKKTIKI